MFVCATIFALSASVMTEPPVKKQKLTDVEHGMALEWVKCQLKDGVCRDCHYGGCSSWCSLP